MSETDEHGHEGQHHRTGHNWVVLFRIGPVTVINFGLFVGLAGMIAGWLALARLAQAGFDLEQSVRFFYVFIPVMILVGSRLMELLINLPAVLRNPGRKLPETGFAFQGGLILSALCVACFAWAQGLNLLRLFDSLCLAIPLGHAIGRVGCLTYGCCHGRPTKSRLAIRFHNPESKPVWKEGLQGIPLHPTQLYAVTGNVAIFIALNALALLGPFHAGTISAAYLMLDSCGRFVIDFFRWPPMSTASAMLKPFQWLSITFFCCGLAMLALSTQMPVVDFSDFNLFANLLLQVAPYWYWVLFCFFILFASFGIHGRTIGRYFGQRADGEC